jgi:predicted AAA+ superfamily ATPase
MIKRNITDKLIKLMKQFPAVGVIGPRQSGKTTLAKTFSKTLKKEALYLDLESQADIRKLSDPELYLKEHTGQCVILDEVQRMPELFPLLRHLIDDKRKPGRFLLLGSAAPDLIRNASESLAGRIFYFETSPFNLTELPDKKNTIQKHWYRGGFPGSFLATNDDKARHWMEGFARTYIERDLNQLFGVSFSPQLMFTLWRMLSHHHGSMWNAHSFSKGLDVSPATVNRYLDYLEGAFIVRKLAPYYRTLPARHTFCKCIKKSSATWIVVGRICD